MKKIFATLLGYLLTIGFAYAQPLTYINSLLVEQPNPTKATVQKREKYEFMRNLPVYADSLIADLTYPMAWGNSKVKNFKKWKRLARKKVFDCMLMPPPPPVDGYKVKVLFEEQREGYKAKKIEIQLSRYYTVPAWCIALLSIRAKSVSL